MLLAVPVGVVILVTAIGPGGASAGTVAVSSVADRYVTPVAAVPPKATLELWLKPAPSIVTTVPGGPVVGLKPLIDRDCACAGAVQPASPASEQTATSHTNQAAFLVNVDPTADPVFTAPLISLLLSERIRTAPHALAPVNDPVRDERVRKPAEVSLLALGAIAETSNAPPVSPGSVRT